jgi:hypothetical protein
VTIRSGASSAARLYTLSYSLIRDSSGEGVKAGDSITLMFGPSSRLYLLATSPDGDLAFIGTWSFRNGTLLVGFSSPDFTRHGKLSLNPSASKVRFPFQIFTSDKGSSLWSENSLDPVTGAYRVADAVAAASANGLPMQQIVAAAGGYVGGITGARVKHAPGFSPTELPKPAAIQSGRSRLKLPHFGIWVGTDGAAISLGMGTPEASSRAASFPHLLSVVESLSGLELGFYDGAQLDVDLGSVVGFDGEYAPLQLAPLASDPRVQLYAKAPGDGADDPAHKRVLVIAPFINTSWLGWVTTGNGLYNPVIRPLMDPGLADEKLELEADGYSFDSVTGAAAGLGGIIAALRTSPGLLDFSTHGGSDGSLCTGQYLGPTVQVAIGAVSVLQAKYHFPTGAVWLCGLDGPGGLRLFASVRPSFWTWLHRSHGLVLSRSLVYISACDTNQAESLRVDIGARAYFGYDYEVNNDVSNAVERYLFDMLSRPTVTAEEVYYNMLRIDQSHELIYLGGQKKSGPCMTTKDAVCDDRAFVGFLSQPLKGLLDAYGDTDGLDLAYSGHGWLSPVRDHGQIWWLLFASRWGQDTKAGVKNLQQCWQKYWSRGQLGGLASPFCNSANDGSLPTHADVRYAIYLASGKLPSGSGTIIPRFTLNDGR